MSNKYFKFLLFFLFYFFNISNVNAWLLQVGNKDNPILLKGKLIIGAAECSLGDIPTAKVIESYEAPEKVGPFTIDIQGKHPCVYIQLKTKKEFPEFSLSGLKITILNQDSIVPDVNSTVRNISFPDIAGKLDSVITSQDSLPEYCKHLDYYLDETIPPECEVSVNLAEEVLVASLRLPMSDCAYSTFYLNNSKLTEVKNMINKEENTKVYYDTIFNADNIALEEVGDSLYLSYNFPLNQTFNGQLPYCNNSNGRLSFQSKTSVLEVPTAGNVASFNINDNIGGIEINFEPANDNKINSKFVLVANAGGQKYFWGLKDKQFKWQTEKKDFEVKVNTPIKFWIDKPILSKSQEILAAGTYSLELKRSQDGLNLGGGDISVAKNLLPISSDFNVDVAPFYDLTFVSQEIEENQLSASSLDSSQNNYIMQHIDINNIVVNTYEINGINRKIVTVPNPVWYRYITPTTIRVYGVVGIIDESPDSSSYNVNVGELIYKNVIPSFKIVSVDAGTFAIKMLNYFTVNYSSLETKTDVNTGNTQTSVIDIPVKFYWGKIDIPADELYQTLLSFADVTVYIGSLDVKKPLLWPDVQHSSILVLFPDDQNKDILPDYIKLQINLALSGNVTQTAFGEILLDMNDDGIYDQKFPMHVLNNDKIKYLQVVFPISVFEIMQQGSFSFLLKAYVGNEKIQLAGYPTMARWQIKFTNSFIDKTGRIALVKARVLKVFDNISNSLKELQLKISGMITKSFTGYINDAALYVGLYKEGRGIIWIGNKTNISDGFNKISISKIPYKIVNYTQSYLLNDTIIIPLEVNVNNFWDFVFKGNYKLLVFFETLDNGSSNTETNNFFKIGDVYSFTIN